MIDARQRYRQLLSMTVGFFWLVALLHVLGMVWSLYVILPWYDILLHVLGGVAVGYTLLSLVARWRSDQELSRSYFLWLLILFLIVVGWEVYEWVVIDVWAQAYRPDDMIDTLTDIACGLGGGGIAWVMTRFFITPQEK